MAFYNKGLFSGMLLLSSLYAHATPLWYDNSNADQVINQLYKHLKQQPETTLAARIDRISAEFLGQPYLLGALGEGPGAEYDEAPLYRTNAFDCETIVDTVLALAFADDLPQFQQCMNQIRYHEGHVSYLERNHFTCLDWNQNNQHQGFIKDITTTIKNEQHQSVVLWTTALIDKPGWYRHKTGDNIRLRKASTEEQSTRLMALKEAGQHLPKRPSTMPYIPLSVLFDKDGKANHYLFNQIPQAAIVEIIRPNWDLEQAIGTRLNVSHLGFAIWKNHQLLFRNASSLNNNVNDVDLIEYLREALKSPTIKGINIQIVLPQNNHCEISKHA